MKADQRRDPWRPVAIEGPVNRSKRIRWTKLLRRDGSTFSVTAKKHVQPGYEDSIVLEELDPPSEVRRVMFNNRATDRARREALDQLEETA